MKDYAILKPTKSGLHLSNKFLLEHLGVEETDHVLVLFNREKHTVELQAFNPFDVKERKTEKTLQNDDAAEPENSAHGTLV